MKLKIAGSVGKKGANKSADVKVVQALLNVYARANKQSSLAINGKSDEDLEKMIMAFQQKQQKMGKPDGQVTSSRSSTFRALVDFMKATRTMVAITKPGVGELTWDAEGQEGGSFHSRSLHVPSLWSGLTIGRGYDMKNRASAHIVIDLKSVGVEMSKANAISKGAGLSGAKAEQVIIDNDLLDFEISVAAQLKLFESVYTDYENTVKRICSKKSVEKAYGKTDWAKLDAAIKVVLIDLTYRGDYHTTSRKTLQKSVADNDFDTFRKLITNVKNWPGWPNDRFQRRRQYLETEKITRSATSSTTGIDVCAKNSVPCPTGTPE